MENQVCRLNINEPLLDSYCKVICDMERWHLLQSWVGPVFFTIIFDTDNL